MEEMIFFDNAKDNVTRFFDKEFLDFPPLVISHFLNSFNELLNYTEEGEMIRPKLVFTNSIETVLKSIPKSQAIPVFEDKDASNYHKRMKSLLAIADDDWLVFIDIKEKTITYGLLMSFSSIKDKNILRSLEDNTTLKDKTPKVYCIVARPLNVYTMQLHSISGNNLTVNFSLDKTKFSQFSSEIKSFIDASFSKLRTTPRKLTDMKNMYFNIFSTVMNNVHGTICVIVDKDYADNGFFEDGIWLKEPISFSKLFTQSKSYSETKLRVYADLLVKMVNFDGITVLDNKGQILAYNVFVETNSKKLGYIVGGARKRAAYYILNSKRKGIVGVFFLSHEGEIFYKELRPRENKALIKKKDEPKKEEFKKPEIPKMEAKNEFKENVENIAQIIEERIDDNTTQLSFSFALPADAPATPLTQPTELNSIKTSHSTLPAQPDTKTSAQLRAADFTNITNSAQPIELNSIKTSHSTLPETDSITSSALDANVNVNIKADDIIKSVTANDMATIAPASPISNVAATIQPVLKD